MPPTPTATNRESWRREGHYFGMWEFFISMLYKPLVEEERKVKRETKKTSTK